MDAIDQEIDAIQKTIEKNCNSISKLKIIQNVAEADYKQSLAELSNLSEVLQMTIYARKKKLSIFKKLFIAHGVGFAITLTGIAVGLVGASMGVGALAFICLGGASFLTIRNLVSFVKRCQRFSFNKKTIKQIRWQLDENQFLALELFKEYSELSQKNQFLIKRLENNNAKLSEYVKYLNDIKTKNTIEKSQSFDGISKE